MISSFFCAIRIFLVFSTASSKPSSRMPFLRDAIDSNPRPIPSYSLPSVTKVKILFLRRIGSNFRSCSYNCSRMDDRAGALHIFSSSGRSYLWRKTLADSRYSLIFSMNSPMKEGRPQSLAGVLLSLSFLRKEWGIDEGHSERVGSDVMVSVCVRELFLLATISLALTSKANFLCSWWTIVLRISC
jgi:hypothetical protein